MRVTKEYMGKYVELSWRDPNEARVSANPRDYTALPRGRAALATWVERGVITDITEGVVRIEHSRAIHAGGVDSQSDEFVFTFVPEELVDTITVFEKREPTT